MNKMRAALFDHTRQFRQRHHEARFGLIPSCVVVAALPLMVLLHSCKDLLPGPPTPPTNDVAIDDAPSWSPLGDLIAYTHLAADVNDTLYPTGLYTIDTSGSHRRLIVPGFAYNPDWSPDGSKIAFSSGEIFTINSNGDSIFQVTSVGTGFFPNWSPDGGKIAFDTQYQDLNGAKAIWLVNADGTGLTDISHHGTGEWREPDWSPSGNRLVHVRFIGIGTEEVFVMDTTGLNGVRLTFNDFSDRYPKWSPDGMSIAWTSGHDIDELWVMNSDGTNQRKITTGEKPSWSPDSHALVHQKSTGNKKLLYILDLTTGVTRQLTF